MIILSTNIYNKLSSLHKEKIAKMSTALFQLDELIELKEYQEKIISSDAQMKFLFRDFPLDKMLNDVKRWESFIELLDNIFQYSSQDISNLNEIQFWMSSIYESLPVNIFFVVKSKKDIRELILSLRDTLLVSNILDNKNISRDTILIVGYDTEDTTWRLNYI